MESRASRSVLRASCVAFCVAVALPVLATTYYVDAENGDDSYDGTAAEWAGGTVGPKQTFAGIAKVTLANDAVVRFARGTYLVEGTLDTPYTRVSFRGVEGDRSAAVIDGQGQFRAFRTGTDGRLYDLTLTNCAVTAANGGAASLSGGIVSNCVFTDCKTLTSGHGAAVYSGSSLQIYDSLVTNCTVSQYGAVNSQTLTLKNVDFIGNRSLSSPACVTFTSGKGLATGCNFIDNESVAAGAVFYFQGGAKSYFTNCLFQCNRATGGGGAVASTGNGAENGKVFSNCRFIRNWGNGEGGCLNFNKPGLELYDCTFDGNCSRTSNGGAVQAQAATAAARIIGCKFYNNSATNGTGGAVRGLVGEVRDCVFSNNVARSSGGAWSYDAGVGAKDFNTALAYSDLPLVVSNCEFYANYLENRAGAFGNGNGYGGAVNLSSTVPDPNATYPYAQRRYKFQRCVFADNHATNAYSTGRYYTSGGGLYSASACRLEDCTFRRNVAAYHGAGFYGNATGGVVRCTFEGNFGERSYPYPFGDSGLAGSVSDVPRGALALTSPIDQTTEVCDCTFTSNTIHGAAGALTVVQGAAKIHDCTFRDNALRGTRNTVRFSTYGGCDICLMGTGGTVATPALYEVERCSFVGAENRADANDNVPGGSVRFSYNATAGANELVLRNCLFAECTATNLYAKKTALGGAVYARAGQKVTVENCTFANNYSSGGGGAVYLAANRHAATSITNCVFFGNTDGTTSAADNDLSGASAEVVGYCYTSNEGGPMADGVNDCLVKAGENPFRADDHTAYAVRKDYGSGASFPLAWMTPDALDCGGKPRLAKDGTVDFGCYQFWRKPGFLLIVR